MAMRQKALVIAAKSIASNALALAACRETTRYWAASIGNAIEECMSICSGGGIPSLGPVTTPIAQPVHSSLASTVLVSKEILRRVKQVKDD